MNQRLKEALRRKIDGHNRLVVLSTIGGALAVVGMWITIYFVTYWMYVLWTTAAVGLDAEAPPHLGRRIGVVLVTWMGIGVIDRRMRRDVEPSADPASLAGIAWRFFMLPVRATFGVWDHQRDKVSLSERELELGSALIERLYRTGKLPLDTLPIELPDDDERERILCALRTTGLVRIRETERESFVSLTNPERVAAFL